MAYRRRRVLIVDDDVHVRDFLTLALEYEAYEVRGAADGLEALAVLGEWRADVIVLDLMMPEMDGRSFLTEQHRVEGFADIPVLIVSALHDLANRARGLSALAVYEKPLALDDFLDAVRSLIDFRTTDQRGC